MRVLWITNMLLPEAMSQLQPRAELKATGGWMVASANKLSSQPNIQLSIAAPFSLVKDLQTIEGSCIRYYAIPYGKGNQRINSQYDSYWKKINEEFNPDIVHIHGTECSHGLSYINVCGNKHVVISIQGLTSVYANYYDNGLSFSQVLSNFAIRDFVRGSIFCAKRNMAKCGEYEKMMIAKVHHIIGRTDWDKAHTWAINQQAKYHFCNETLREEFYNGKWSFEGCDKHTIFLSQAGNPIKALHQVLKALPLIIKEYPDTKIRIAGRNILNYGIKQKSGYHKLINKLIEKYKLSDYIFFTGPLNADEMKMEYLRANVFLSPSTIENSPNSLGEAQVLGVPSITSFVGGVLNLIPSTSCGYMYRFEDVEMLAYYVCQVFAKREFNNETMIETAKKRHDPIDNCKQLLNIYNTILES